MQKSRVDLFSAEDEARADFLREEKKLFPHFNGELEESFNRKKRNSFSSFVPISERNRTSKLVRLSAQWRTIVLSRHVVQFDEKEMFPAVREKINFKLRLKGNQRKGKRFEVNVTQ